MGRVFHGSGKQAPTAHGHELGEVRESAGGIPCNKSVTIAKGSVTAAGADQTAAGSAWLSLPWGVRHFSLRGG